MISEILNYNVSRDYWIIYTCVHISIEYKINQCLILASMLSFCEVLFNSLIHVYVYYRYYLAFNMYIMQMIA